MIWCTFYNCHFLRVNLSMVSQLMEMHELSGVIYAILYWSCHNLHWNILYTGWCIKSGTYVYMLYVDRPIHLFQLISPGHWYERSTVMLNTFFISCVSGAGMLHWLFASVCDKKCKEWKWSVSVYFAPPCSSCSTACVIVILGNNSWSFCASVRLISLYQLMCVSGN